MNGDEFRKCSAGVILVSLALICFMGHCGSPNLDEVGHLPAGYAVAKLSSFELYEVNPPLVKTLSAVPLLLVGVEGRWAGYSDAPGARSEWSVGRYFIAANGERSFWLFTLARWALLPIWLLGTYVIYCWARELAGQGAGLAAIVAWCFCPEVMAWTATICPDSAAASMGVLAVYCFRGWLKDTHSTTAAFSGLTLGLALLTKTTWLILIPLFPLLATIRNGASRAVKVRHLVLMGIVALYVLNSGYGFTRSFERLGDYRFFSATLAGRDDDGALRKRIPEQAGNRFADTWLADLPVPLPGSFVEGLDLQKWDFEEGKWSYLRGEHKFRGWWYWYLYALLVKTPIGLLALGAIATVLIVRKLFWVAREDSACGAQSADSTGQHEGLTDRQELILLLSPALAVFLLVSSQTGFSRYLRYVLPCYPFVFVAMGLVFSKDWNPWKSVRVGSGLMLAWAVVSSLCVYPHSLSYFNEFAGGPNRGPAHLIDASIDWGQDVLFLADWCEQHPEAAPLYLSLHVFFDPRIAGIDYRHPPVDPRYASDRRWVTSDDVGPLPGWYAISVHQLYSRTKEFDYLFDFERVDQVGYSIYIYHITESQAEDWHRRHASEISRGDRK